jgi:hypothetical protein
LWKVCLDAFLSRTDGKAPLQAKTETCEWEAIWRERLITRPNEFEQFLMLFTALREKAQTPLRLVTFHGLSEELKGVVRQFEDFMLATDFERSISDRKLHMQVPRQFEKNWKQYKAEWAYAIAFLFLQDIWPEGVGNFDPSGIDKHSELEIPDPEENSSFNPLFHSGGAAAQLGLDYLAHVYEARKDGEFENDERIANTCRICLGAFDYLSRVIGVRIGVVFERWQSLPPFFMPAAVSDQHGREKGSLNDLLNDAIRAYVCGAPAAALALCRSSLEVLLKKHYLPHDYQRVDKNGKLKDKPLDDLIVLAERRYDSWRRERMRPRVRHLNDILHDYSRVERLDEADSKFVLDYLLTLRNLIILAPEKAP